MDPHNKSHFYSPHQSNPLPQLKTLTEIYREVVEFNHSFAPQVLQQNIDGSFPLDEIETYIPLERELHISELLAEKVAAFEALVSRHSVVLEPLGLSLALRSTSSSSPDVVQANAMYHLTHGSTFCNFLSTLAGKQLPDKDNVTLLSIIEDLLSYLQFQSDLTDSNDAAGIEFAGALGKIIRGLKGIPRFPVDPIISALSRYHSFALNKCLYEVITLERAGIFQIDSLRLNESKSGLENELRKEFIHIPYSNPSLRWHIICNHVENYRNVWQYPLQAIEKLLPRQDCRQLITLAITTTLENLSWIKCDLNSNEWNFRDDDQTEEFKIVVDEVAARLSEMLSQLGKRQKDNIQGDL